MHVPDFRCVSKKCIIRALYYTAKSTWTSDTSSHSRLIYPKILVLYLLELRGPQNIHKYAVWPKVCAPLAIILIHGSFSKHKVKSHTIVEQFPFPGTHSVFPYDKSGMGCLRSTYGQGCTYFWTYIVSRCDEIPIQRWRCVLQVRSKTLVHHLSL